MLILRPEIGKRKESKLKMIKSCYAMKASNSLEQFGF